MITKQVPCKRAVSYTGARVSALGDTVTVVWALNKDPSHPWPAIKFAVLSDSENLSVVSVWLKTRKMAVLIQ